MSKVFNSDEPEPSWLEPGLKLNNFQLSSARLVTFSIQLGNFSIKARKIDIFVQGQEQKSRDKLSFAD